MPVNAGWGELLIGAYHQRVTGCEVVSYNNRSEEQGNQMEADVIAIDNNRESGEQSVYVCEVVTHLRGNLYSGSPNDKDGWWMEYSNTSSYHHSLEKLQRKFLDDYQYVEDAFPEDADYFFQFWAPVVSGAETNGPLIRGLDELATQFEDRTGESLELIINRDYTSRIDELHERAEGDKSDYGSPAFRFLQILNNLK